MIIRIKPEDQEKATQSRLRRKTISRQWKKHCPTMCNVGKRKERGKHHIYSYDMDTTTTTKDNLISLVTTYAKFYQKLSQVWA